MTQPAHTNTPPGLPLLSRTVQAILHGTAQELIWTCGARWTKFVKNGLALTEPLTCTIRFTARHGCSVFRYATHVLSPFLVNLILSTPQNLKGFALAGKAWVCTWRLPSYIGW